jgi:hypothetical protein
MRGFLVTILVNRQSRQIKDDLRLEKTAQDNKVLSRIVTNTGSPQESVLQVHRKDEYFPEAKRPMQLTRLNSEV